MKLSAEFLRILAGEARREKKSEARQPPRDARHNQLTERRLVLTDRVAHRRSAGRKSRRTHARVWEQA